MCFLLTKAIAPTQILKSGLLILIAFAHASIVAPVVITSSTNRMFFPSKRLLRLTLKAPWTFCQRSAVTFLSACFFVCFDLLSEFVITVAFSWFAMP